VRAGLGRALAAGAVGAAAVTIANEVGRRTIADAPRLDLLGTRALSKLASPGGVRRFLPGKRKELWRTALAGDLAANALLYALAAPGRSPRPVARGLFLGTLAGVGAVLLAPKLGLGHRPSDATVETAVLTVAWYAIGGVAAGVAARALATRASTTRVDDVAPAGVATAHYPWPPAQRTS
jgi:hypothetical protein